MNDDQFDEMFYNATMPDFCQYCHSAIDDPDSGCDCDGATIDRLTAEIADLRRANKNLGEQNDLMFQVNDSHNEDKARMMDKYLGRIAELEGEVERLRVALRAVMEKSKPSNYRRYTDDGSMGYVVERLHFVPEDVVKQAAQALEASGRDVGEQRYIVCHQDTTGTVDKGKVLYLREKAEQVVEAFNEVCNETGKFYWYEPAKEQPQ